MSRNPFELSSPNFNHACRVWVFGIKITQFPEMTTADVWRFFLRNSKLEPIALCTRRYAPEEWQSPKISLVPVCGFLHVSRQNTSFCTVLSKSLFPSFIGRRSDLVVFLEIGELRRMLHFRDFIGESIINIWLKQFQSRIVFYIVNKTVKCDGCRVHGAPT
jgi:hypothetical protein